MGVTKDMEYMYVDNSGLFHGGSTAMCFPAYELINSMNNQITHQGNEGCKINSHEYNFGKQLLEPTLVEEVQLDTYNICVIEVGIDSPAAHAGIRVGDKIIDQKLLDVVNDHSVNDILSNTKSHKLIIERDTIRQIKIINQIYDPTHRRWVSGLLLILKKDEPNNRWCQNHPLVAGTKHTLTLGGKVLCKNCVETAFDEKYGKTENTTIKKSWLKYDNIILCAIIIGNTAVWIISIYHMVKYGR
jgi:hypothetical protein